MSYLKSHCRTSYTSSMETITLHCLIFEKIAYLYAFLRQTDEEMDSPDALRRCRCRERRLNKMLFAVQCYWRLLFRLNVGNERLTRSHE